MHRFLTVILSKIYPSPL